MGRATKTGSCEAVIEDSSSGRFPKRQRVSQPQAKVREETPEEEEERDEEVQDVEVGNEEAATADSCGKGARLHFRGEYLSQILCHIQLYNTPCIYLTLCIQFYLQNTSVCDNGHIICNSCSIEITNNCPSCQLPIGHGRSKAIEKVLESIQVTCENAKYGCKETVSFNKKHDHEEACLYALRSCSISGCGFVGSSRQL
ncbi:E3 ubiquitin-protein ligase [Melia azedarach]|uniref:E3 ubiquitin-protein ligase n=1 Tax=Melia azedarach TaxID=155640 RepID=A0ACC1X6L5_MELAZ|nr:E3 ubiquitin-protein ligase [Melia azedarach]